MPGCPIECMTVRRRPGPLLSEVDHRLPCHFVRCILGDEIFACANTTRPIYVLPTLVNHQVSLQVEHDVGVQVEVELRTLSLFPGRGVFCGQVCTLQDDSDYGGWEEGEKEVESLQR